MADYGLLGGIGEGLKAAAQGFGQGFEMRNQAEARKQAQLDAIKNRQLMAFEKGVTEGEDGKYSYTPEKLAQLEKEDLKTRMASDTSTAKEGYRPKYDESGKYTGVEIDPGSLKKQLADQKNESAFKMLESKIENAKNDPAKQMALDYRKNQIEKQQREEQGLLDPREVQKEVIQYEKNSAANLDNSKLYDHVDKLLGFNLMDYDESTGAVKKIDPKTGKETLQKTDIAGVSIPGYGRIFPGEKAQALKSAASALFNAKLKDRSGSTVTDSELERLKDEFSAGKYATEEQMIGAMKRARQIVAEHAQRVDDAYGPQILGEAKKRGLKGADFYYASTFGTNPEQVAVSRQNQIPQKGLLNEPKQAGLLQTGMLKEANASAPNPEDAAALQWATQNPKDPRSAEIMKRLGQ